MTIKVWDYLPEYEAERDEILSAIDDVFRSGQLILGPKVAAFEESFARYIGASHGVGVNSGTDALVIGLKALGIGSGDEVITVANTAVPTIAAITLAGATPTFVDINPRTYLMDVTLLEEAITPRTKCILPVHLFGQCVDMDEVRRIARTHGLLVMEDCAQAHGARFQGAVAGSMSDLSAFSFYPTKILGTYGDGGLIATDNAALAASAKRLRFYGMETTYFSIENGYNSRLDELHAAVLLKKLARLDEYISRRRSLAQKYDELLANCDLGLPLTAEGNEHSFYLYVCSHPRRDRILELLKAKDIHLNVSYRWPVHLMPAYAHLGYKEGSLPETEAAAERIFSLPMYPALTEAQQHEVCETLRSIVRAV